MPRRTLTDRYLKSLKPPRDGKPDDADTDAIVPGLVPRVMGSGQITFVLVARYPGHPHPTRRALGSYGELSLEKARSKARLWLELIRAGIDPKVKEEEQRQAELRKQEHSFISVAEEYIAHIKRQEQRRARDVERDLRREFINRWNSRPITSIGPDDVAAVIKEVLARGARHQARNLLAYIRTLFEWVIASRIYGVEHNPCARLKPKVLIGTLKPREQTLDDLQFRAFWNAAGRMGYPFGPMYQLLALTGQRRDQVAGARWSEFDLDRKLWKVPPKRHKSGSTHLVPLSDAAVALLRELPRFQRGDHLFSTTFGTKPPSGFSKAKARLDRLMLEELRTTNGDAAQLSEWVIHDLRRVVRSALSALRVPDTVAEAVIGHGRRGIARVYDLHRYEPEMREALTLWANRLRDIVEPPPPNLIKMREAAQ
jgi:integrase